MTLYISVVGRISKLIFDTLPFISVTVSKIVSPDKYANFTFQFTFGPPKKNPILIFTGKRFELSIAGV